MTLRFTKHISQIFSATAAAVIAVCCLQSVAQRILAEEQVEPPLKRIGTRIAGSDWRTFLGPSGDSKSTEKGILTKWPKAGLRIVWQRKLGGSYGIGATSHGRYYQFDRQGDECQLVCLDAETGVQMWEFRYPTDYEDLLGYAGGPRCSPVIDGNRVYAYGPEGLLHCLRASDGKLLWKVDTFKTFAVVQNFFGVGSTPVVHGDLLLVMVGGSTPDSLKLAPGDLSGVQPNGSAIVAFDKRTGKVRYRAGQDLSSYAGIKLAKIGNRHHAFVFARRGLWGLNPDHGTIDFHFPWRARILESVNASTPVVHGSQVLISETYGPGTALLDAAVLEGGQGQRKPKVIWQDDPRRRDKALQAHWNTPVLHQGYLYGCSGRHDNNAELRCIEWQTGKVQWSVPGLARTSLLYVDGHLLCLSEIGAMLLIKADPAKPQVLAQTDFPAPQAPKSDLGFRNSLLRYPCWAAPILSHGLLYVRGRDRLLCLELIPTR